MCDTTDSSYSRVNKTARINTAYEEIVGKLIASDGTFQFDDSNYTSLPIGKATLVAGQQDYSFDVTMLNVLGVSVLDSNGIWQKLKPIDFDMIERSEGVQRLAAGFGAGIDPAEYRKTNGMPVEYDKQGGSILLYPAPAAANVTLTAGLKVYFQRTASLFSVASNTNADTTVPGFASPYHVILAYKAALPYCMTYKKDRVPLYLNEINRLEKELLAFYAGRTKDERKIMSMRQILFR